MTCHDNTNQKKAKVAILISDKVNFRVKDISKDKESNFRMISRSIYQEYIAVLKVYIPGKALKFIKQKLRTIRKTDKCIIIVGDCNTPSQ